MNYDRKKEEDLILYLGKAYENKKYRIPFGKIEEDLNLSRDELSSIINVIHDKGTSFKITGGEEQAVSILSLVVQKARKIEGARNKEIRSQKEKWYHDTKFVISAIIALIATLFSVYQHFSTNSHSRETANIFADVSKDGNIIRSNKFLWEIKKTKDRDGNILYTLVDRRGDPTAISVVPDNPKYTVYQSYDGMVIKFTCAEEKISDFTIKVKY